MWRKFEPLGYWTDDLEDWFRIRLKQIRTGEAQPLMRRDWRPKIRMHGTAKRLHTFLREQLTKLVDEIVE